MLVAVLERRDLRSKVTMVRAIKMSDHEPVDKPAERGGDKRLL